MSFAPQCGTAVSTSLRKLKNPPPTYGVGFCCACVESVGLEDELSNQLQLS